MEAYTCPWIRRINIIKVTILTRAIYTFNEFLPTKLARAYNGAKTVPSINGGKETGVVHAKNEIRSPTLQYTKINSKWIKCK